ncbi:hypothetical protein RM844_11730 [Streptomyces sp. DSM 44915]|uniref:DUF2812 domain-containing protein n=1 Tax=Streptomyces chisholmiae TaxID=3075540 RepID=A0ABU2JQG2_9ACTN|nr:hypothetical protein [Streptomyces sp. DSM 44915]MDT0266961.1 hypothetical protein [Streptomyces sp. DSM 44915]
MREWEIVGRFDGSPRVEFPVRLELGNVVAIGYEFGYVVDEVRTTSQQVPYRLVFRRDDSEAARRRAAWTWRSYRATGVWWAGCWPPHLHDVPGTVHPVRAGEARLALHRLAYEGRTRLVVVLVVGGVLALFLAWSTRQTGWPGALLAVLGVALLGGTLLTGRLVGWARARHRALLARFERQRHAPRS